MGNKKIASPIYTSEDFILEEYYKWLCHLIRVNQNGKSYWLLAKALHSKVFVWSIPNDDNRAFEGKNLRERFCEENEYTYVYDYFNSPASMLEVIIALAYRCESIMEDQNGNIPMVDWFWMLMSNVKLDKFTDVGYYDLYLGGDIDHILDKIINRTYHRNGQGGLFPLRHHKKDQRKVELWYQMSNYLVENYYTEDVFV